jgi:hypothetical protein
MINAPCGFNREGGHIVGARSPLALGIDVKFRRLGVTMRPQLPQPAPAKLSIRKWGAIMYALVNIDFGVIVSELPDEIDDKDQTLDAKRGAALSDLEMAVFAAA